MIYMKITPSNILCHELIGLEVRIEQYTDPSLVNVTGRVVDETLKTLVIEREGGKRIRVFKANGVFVFKTPDGREVTVVGEDVVGRPWDRLKKNIKKCWV